MTLEGDMKQIKSHHIMGSVWGLQAAFGTLNAELTLDQSFSGCLPDATQCYAGVVRPFQSPMRQDRDEKQALEARGR